MSAAPILTITRNGETLKSCAVEGEVVLGRAEGCVIRLDDRAISRQHAVFRALSEGIQVEKKSDFAPLKVNGAECTSAVIREGDVIAIGPYLVGLSYAKSQEREPQALRDGSAQKKVWQEVQNQGLEKPLEPSVSFVEPSVTEDDESISQTAEVPNQALGYPALDAAPTLGFQEEPVQDDLPPLVSESANSLSLADVGIADEGAQTKVMSTEKIAIRLVFPQGAAQKTEFDLNQDEVSIGRGKGCDVILNDKKSSRRNCVIRRSGMEFVLLDLGSSNGTYVNGKRVEEQALSAQDRVRIGDVEFEFQIISADYVKKERDFLPVQVVDRGDAMSEESAPQLLSDSELPVDVPNFSSEPVQDPDPNAFMSQSREAPIAPSIGGAMASPHGFVSGAAPEQIAGIGSVTDTKPKTLLEKFRALPKKRQYIWVAFIIVFGYFIFIEEDPQPVVTKKTPRSGVSASPSKGPSVGSASSQLAFEALTPEQKRFVEDQHRLAFDHFKNQDFDKSLYELSKIFELVSDYKDSRDIERYAKEGKRRLEAKEEEKRRKAEEARIKAKVEELVNEARERMAQKQYRQAREIFPQIHLLDPENAQVQKWVEEIESFEQEQRLSQQKEEVRKEINQQGWLIYREGMGMKKRGKYQTAISLFSKVIEIGVSDPLLQKNTRKRISECRAAIRALRDPLLQEAKQLESSGEFAKAYEVYKKAARVDPNHPDAYAGMDRTSKFLHDRAKVLYTEAVLAESYSDFSTAKKKFQEIMATTPKDDIYFERAQRKSARYFKSEEAPQ